MRNKQADYSLAEGAVISERRNFLAKDLLRCMDAICTQNSFRLSQKDASISPLVRFRRDYI